MDGMLNWNNETLNDKFPKSKRGKFWASFTKCLPVHPHFLVVDMSIWATSPLGVAVRYVICGFYLFFPPGYVALWDPKTPHRPGCERASYCVETFPTSWLPPWDGSTSLSLLSLFLSFIFCPTSFQRQWAAFLGAWCPLPAFRSCFVKVAQHWNDLLMNLWGESGLPVLFLHHIRTARIFFSFNLYKFFLLGKEGEKWQYELHEPGAKKYVLILVTPRGPSLFLLPLID